MATSRARFEEAVKLDPKFSRAWGYLSYSYVRSVLVGWLDRSELTRAEEYARRAVQLDTEAFDGVEAADYAPYWDLAFVYLSQGKLAQALAQYEIAVDLYNNFTDRLDRKPGLLAEAAVANILDGNRSKAINMLQKAQLVPGWYRWNLGFAYYMESDYERALEQLMHPDLDPESPQFIPEILLFRACAQARSGDTEGANESIALLRQRQPAFDLAYATSRWTFKEAADNDHWREGLRMAGLE
ncbi:MAG: tetratricopeptide repeat protein [Kiloniellales bacterium]